MSLLKKFTGILLGFRKFAIMLIIVTTGIVFRLTDYINGSELVDLLKGTVVAFFASNAGEHMTKAVIAWVKNK